ncbi:hypothetical protein BaRGS_00022019, partial [Batillaria attramentaria]
MKGRTICQMPLGLLCSGHCLTRVGRGNYRCHSSLALLVDVSRVGNNFPGMFRETLGLSLEARGLVSACLV